MKEYSTYIKEIFNLKLFPQNMQDTFINQGMIGDCHLLACIDCLIHMGASGEAFLKSLFTITTSCILVKIKSSYLLNEENQALARQKYHYSYDPLTQEHCFFVSALDSIFDWRAQSLKTNAYAITILEHLISYFYTIALDDGSQGASLAAHDNTNRHRGYFSTEFLAKILGLGLLSFANPSFTLQHLIQFKRLNPNYPVYLSLSTGLNSSRHAYRLKSIQGQGENLTFVLINPWNNQKEEILPLSLIKKQKPHAGIFFLDKRQALLTQRLLTLPEKLSQSVFENAQIEKALLAQFGPDYEDKGKIRQFIKTHPLYLEKTLKLPTPIASLENQPKDLTRLAIEKGIEELGQIYQITQNQAKIIVISSLESFFATDDLRLLMPRSLRPYFKDNPLEIEKIPNYLIEEESLEGIEKAMAAIIQEEIERRVNLFGISIQKATSEVWLRQVSLYLFQRLIEFSTNNTRYHYMEAGVIGPIDCLPRLFSSPKHFLDFMLRLIIEGIENTDSMRSLIGILGPFQPALEKAAKRFELHPEELSLALQKLEAAYKEKLKKLFQKNESLFNKRLKILQTLETLGYSFKFEECTSFDELKIKKQRLEAQLVALDASYDKTLHAIVNLGMDKPSTVMKFKNKAQKLSCQLRLKLGRDLATMAKTLMDLNPEECPYQLIWEKPSLFERSLKEKITLFKLQPIKKRPSLITAILLIFEETATLKERLEAANTLEAQELSLKALKAQIIYLEKGLSILNHFETTANLRHYCLELIDLKITKELFGEEFKIKEAKLKDYFAEQLTHFKQLKLQSSQKKSQKSVLSFFPPLTLDNKDLHPKIAVEERDNFAFDAHLQA